MKSVLITLFVVATAVFSGHARAETRTHHKAHVTFWIPGGWTVAGDEDSQLQAADPKGEVALLFTVQNADNMKAAIAAIDDTIARTATHVKTGTPQRITINGMEAVVVDGTGRIDDKRVELSVLLAKTPNDHFLMIFGVLESAHKHAHDAELRKILSSLQPVR